MPAFRTMFALSTLFALTFASGIKVGPGSPLSPLTIPNTPQVQSQRQEAPRAAQPTWGPTYELLVTVSALRDLTRQASFEAANPEALAQLLSELRQRPSLSAAEASEVLQKLRSNLGVRGEQQLAEARALLERRAALQLASSRIARGEGWPDAAFYRLAFQVPGGQATLRAVEDGKDINPFRQGMPSSVLQLIVSRLAR